jgi:hypothetical protein
MSDPATLAARLRALATSLIDGADAAQVARALRLLASEIAATRRPERPSGATPAREGEDRQWRP